jgi:hypothetical protein
VFSISPQALVQAKAAAAVNDERLAPALGRLQREARGAMKAGPFSVTSNSLVPPSGDKHDYISFGPYWWPDPAKNDGLPYIRRDGVVNPESRSPDCDSNQMGKMVSAVETLALCYFFTGDEACAQRAAKVLRVWFLDPDTKMNPNLNFGQGIPGRMTGRGTGIIETQSLIRVVDAMGLLSTSAAWKAQDQQGMRDWFAAYLDWLRTSKHGQDEARAKNNHGSWYDAQVTAFALFLGQDRFAREVVEASRQKRIALQIEPDGRQPLELERTKPFGYCTFNLMALFTLAQLGDRLGVDLWHYETHDGRSLRRALDFLAQYADPGTPWPYKDLHFERTALIPLLQQGACVYGETYQQALAKLPPIDVARSQGQLTYGRPRPK